jgi:hypothetical protein
MLQVDEVMRDPLALYREIQLALESRRELHRALDPMRDIRKALDAMRIRDPLAERRLAWKQPRPHDPLTEHRKAMEALRLHDPMTEHRKAMEALRLHDPLAETRKLLESLKYIDPLQHTRELFQALQTSTDLYRSLHNRGVAASSMAATMVNLDTYADVEVDTATTQDVLKAISRTLRAIRTAVSMRLLDRLGVEFYLNLIITLLLFLYQLQLSDESEKRIVGEITATREQIIRKFEDTTAEQVDPSTYYVVRHTCVLRRSPKSNSPAVGVVYPNQLTRLVQWKGKRIRVEYFDHLSGVHLSGWCLKKYLERLPPGSTGSRGQAHQ